LTEIRNQHRSDGGRRGAWSGTTGIAPTDRKKGVWGRRVREIMTVVAESRRGGDTGQASSEGVSCVGWSCLASHGIAWGIKRTWEERRKVKKNVAAEWRRAWRTEGGHWTLASDWNIQNCGKTTGQLRCDVVSDSRRHTKEMRQRAGGGNELTKHNLLGNQTQPRGKTTKASPRQVSVCTRFGRSCSWSPRRTLSSRKRPLGSGRSRQ